MNNPCCASINVIGAPCLCWQVIAMIDSEDWVGIGRLLQENQHKTIGTEARSSGIGNILRVITSNSNLQFDLLKKKNDEHAKALFSLLITLGGSDFVHRKFNFEMLDYDSNQQENHQQEILLHAAIASNYCMEVVSKLIEIGGKDIVLAKDYAHGWNSLHFACMHNAPIDVVSKLIEVGERDLVATKNKLSCQDPLHSACENNASIDVVSSIKVNRYRRKRSCNGKR